MKSINEYRTKLNDNVYETDELIAQYCDFHYGSENFGVKNFCQNSVELLKPYLKDIKTSKALDLGCSVGRASFELAKTFDEVMGIDFSANFINVGVKLKIYDSLIYKVKKEGEIFEEKSVSLKDLGLDIEPFEQVQRLAKLTQESGLDGVVCSAQEAKMLRETLGQDFALVTPGIRPEGSNADDQKRIVTPKQAMLDGSTHLVIGRPITKSENPRQTLKDILATL